jgi:hypothetical protein
MHLTITRKSSGKTIIRLSIWKLALSLEFPSSGA